MIYRIFIRVTSLISVQRRSRETVYFNIKVSWKNERIASFAGKFKVKSASK